MDRISGSPYVQLTFDKVPALTSGSAASIAAAVGAAGAEDIVVLSHGWKFEEPGAQDFYRRLWAPAASRLTRPPATKIVVIGIVWPSKRYVRPIDEAVALPRTGTGVLSGEDGGRPEDAPLETLEASAAATADLFGDEVDGLVRDFLDDPTNDDSTDALLKALIDAAVTGDADGEIEAQRAGLEASGERLSMTLAALSAPPRAAPEPGSPQTLGLGDDIQRAFQGPRAAVLRLLEQLSFYEMKRRAGKVGVVLGATLSDPVMPRDVRIHLVGHSFGARVVTAAADRLAVRPQSLALLQGAFSHSALSQARNGLFAAVAGRVKGPVVITHTHNDRALAVAYPLASRLSNDSTSGIGDASDPFGAMGANGALDILGARIGDDPPFGTPKRGVTNYLADAYVVKTNDTDAHNNVTTAQIGQLLARAIEA